MAERPPVKVRPVTRNKLLEVFGSHELVKAFEDMTDDVGQTLPDSVLVNEEAIEAAQDTADQAILDAAAAQATANAAQAAAAAAQADADTLETHPYLTVNLVAALPNERRLTVGAGLVSSDGGAGGNFQIDSSDQRIVQPGDVSNSTVNFADVTGMAVTLAAGQTWLVEALLVAQSAATTTGLGLAFKVPAGAAINGAWSHNVTTTTTEGSYNIADDSVAANTSGVPVATQNLPVTGRWVVANAGAAGVAQLRLRSEVAASAVTLKAGSVLRAVRIS